MHPFLNTAITAARKAGDVILRSLDTPEKIDIQHKGPNDLVTSIDKEAEAVILKTLKKAYPDHGFLCEESGEIEGSSDYVWVIDPLDGTRNFAHGFPQYAVSIALMSRGVVEHGVIYDPNRDELFTASKGAGARLNDRRMRVSKQHKLDHALVGSGFPFREPEHVQTAYMNLLQNIIPITGDLRRAGAAALDLAYVAAGRLDAFFEVGLKPWDVAAGALMIKEAGGFVCDFTGQEDYIHGGQIIASNPKLLKSVAKIVAPMASAVNQE